MKSKIVLFIITCGLGWLAPAMAEGDEATTENRLIIPTKEMYTSVPIGNLIEYNLPVSEEGNRSTSIMAAAPSDTRVLAGSTQGRSRNETFSVIQIQRLVAGKMVVVKSWVSHTGIPATGIPATTVFLNGRVTSAGVSYGKFIDFWTIHFGYQDKKNLIPEIVFGAWPEKGIGGIYRYSLYAGGVRDFVMRNGQSVVGLPSTEKVYDLSEPRTLRGIVIAHGMCGGTTPSARKPCIVMVNPGIHPSSVRLVVKEGSKIIGNIVPWRTSLQEKFVTVGTDAGVCPLCKRTYAVVVGVSGPAIYSADVTPPY